MANFFDQYDAAPSQPAASLPAAAKPKANIFDQYDAPAAPLVAKRPERTWGEAATDTVRGLASGVGSVVKGVGTIGGLATGNMDNSVTRLGDSVQEHWQGRQSDALKFDKAQRSDAIDAADGIVGKAGTAIRETITNPALLVDTVAETAASMIPAGIIGKAGAVVSGTRALSQGATAAQAATRAVKVGTAAGIGTGAVQAGADVAGGTYDDSMASDDAALASNPEYVARVAAGESPEAVKHALALSASRTAFAAAVPLSVATQFIPGGSTIERAVAGAAAKAGTRSGLAARGVNAVKGVVGEGLQETLEEGGGQFVGNLAQQAYVDPNTDLAEGVGESAGLGFVGGAGLGGVAGAAQRPTAQTAGARGGAGRPQPVVQPAGEITRAADPSVQEVAVPPPVYADARPGSLSDAANVVVAARTAARPKPDDSGFRAQAMRPSAPAAQQQDELVTMPIQAPGPQLAEGSVPQAFDIPAPPNVPWINADTGEFNEPSDTDIEGFIHEQFNQQMANGRGVNVAVIRKALTNSGLPAPRRNPLITKVQGDRKRGITGIVAEGVQSELEQDRAELDSAVAQSATSAAAPSIAQQESLLPTAVEAPDQDLGTAPQAELASAPPLAATPDQSPQREQSAPPLEPVSEDGSVRESAAAPTSPPAAPSPALQDQAVASSPEVPSTADSFDAHQPDAPVSPPGSAQAPASAAPAAAAPLSEQGPRPLESGPLVAADQGAVPSAQATPATTTVQAAAAQAATSPDNDQPTPSDAQLAAGNFRVGRMKIAGLDVSIEHPAGSVRKEGHVPMSRAYGYFRRSEAKDGDKVDVFLGDRAGDPALPVFVIDQVDKDGKYDEAKVVMGEADEASARKAYLDSYPKGWTGLGAITQMTQDEFKAWVKDPSETKKPAANQPPSGEEWAAAVAQAKNAWDTMDRGQRSYFVRQTEFSGAKFGLGVDNSLTTKEWNDLPPNVKRAFAIRQIGAQRSAVPAKTKTPAAVVKQSLTTAETAPAIASPALEKVPFTPKKSAVAPVSAEAAPEQGKVIMRGGRPQYSAGARETLEAYFQPGRIVKGYGGADRVLGFDWNDGAWSVRVQHVDKDGNPVANEGERSHSTQPETRALVEVLGKPMGKASRAKAAAIASPPATPAAPAPTTAKAPATPAETPIVDLGEKIGGARKDLSGGREPKKAESPRYEAVAARDGKSWMVQDAKTKKRVVSPGGYTASLYPTEDAATTAATALNQARDKAKASDSTWRKRYAVVDNSTGEIGRKPWAVRDMRTGRMMRGSEAATEAEAEALIPLLVVSLNHRARPMDDGKFEIWRAVTDRKRVKVVKQAFDSRDEAMRYMAEHAVAIIETKTRFGEDVLAKPDTVNRKGPERRTEPVAGQDFMDTFGFRGVEFGNWNNQVDRQEVMNHAFDGLLDLADLLGIPPAAISLEGDLALAFGARGQGLTGARAHYEPKRGVINLTKMSGAGALAHEWFHALDHYFGRQDRKKPDRTVGADGTSTFETEAMLSQGNIAASGVRPELLEKYRELVQGMFTKAERYVDDTALAQKFAGATQEALAGSLQKIRDHLAKNRTYGAKTKAATEEQLAEFDALADTLLTTPQTFEFKPTKAPAHSKFPSGAGRQTNDTLEAMSAILRAVTGRAGFNADKAGDLDMVRGHVKRHGERIAMLASAERQDTKTKRVPTAFAMFAKAIDQGSASDYWTTPDEMAARAFSAYVEDKIEARGDSSDFLSYGSDNRFYVMEGIRPFPEGAERTALAAAFDDFFATVQTKTTDKGTALFSRRGWAQEFPDAVLGASPGVAQAHPDYEAAKAGDDAAALRLARDLVTDSYVAALRAGLPKGAKPTIVPVLAEEAAGRNRIPLAVAKVLGEKLGVPVNTGILQADKVSRGGSDGFHRLANSPSFSGEVAAGDYLILDDTLAQGGTLAELKTHIEDNGGKVLLASALTGKGYSSKIALSDDQLAVLRERYGSIENWWRDTFGHGFEGFTQSEARFVLKLRDRPSADALRARVDASRVRRVGSVDGRNDPDGRDQPALKSLGTSQAGARGGLSFGRAQQLKTELTEKWGDNAPNVVLVQDAEGFPAGAKVDPSYRRGEGFYNGSPTVWINVGQITTEQRFAEVLAHEALGHYGVERVVGEKQWAGIVDAIEKLDQEKTGSDSVRRILAEVHQKQPGLSRDNFAREAIAFMAEKGVRNTFTGRVIAAVRRYLRQIMPTMQWSENDVRSLLSQADGFLHRGRTAPERARMVQSYSFSAVRDDGSANEIVADDAFVAGLSEKERQSGAMVGLARALWDDMGIESPFFRDWFGDSKVVDKDGQPLKVFHGTAEEFGAFDPKRAGKSTNHMTARLGLFFDASKDKAAHYARLASNDVPAEQHVLEVHLAISNPYKMASAEFMAIDGTDVAEAKRAQLKREGYDGIQLPDFGQWIAFDAEQVKSTSNRGTFDRAENRMLFSKAPAEVIGDIEQDMKDIAGLAEHSGTIVERARAALRDVTPPKVKDALRSTWLGALTLRHLTTLGSDYFAGTMTLYSDLLAQMGADRNQLQTEAETLGEAVRKWASKNRAMAAALFDLMHSATIDGVDPSKDYQAWELPEFGGERLPANRANLKLYIAAMREQMLGRGGDAVSAKKDRFEKIKQARAIVNGEPRRRRSYPTMVERWNALSPEAQQHYVEMRDMYATRRDQVEQALVERINDLKLEGDSGQQKQVLTKQIREQFESARLQGVYFPLQRFGKYFVAAERNGTPVYLMFEGLSQNERAVRELKARGYTIKAHGLKTDAKAKDAPSESFVADVLNKLHKGKVSTQVQDEIYQLFLHQLPELSMRKHAIHRKSVQGFDTDAVRAFAFNMTHGAHQLARLRHSHKLAGTIDLLKQRQDKDRKEPGADVRRIAAGDAILGELDKRHEWISNPQDSSATNLVSSFGFVYYLGLTPAAAIVNLTQTALVTYPYLASRFGAVKAMSYLLAAGRDAGRTLGHIQKRLTDPDEIRAHQVLQEMGALDKTQAHNLAGIAEGGMQGYNPAWARAMEIIGWGFHKTEVINREASGIAAYRLARSEGQSFDQAVKLAAETINDTHFDYTNANRARFMQSGTAKVLLMFRQYSLNMTWHLGRMLWKATKGESPEVKRLARRNLAGVLGMSALFSGAMGLPMMGVTMGVLNSIASSFGDDDEPWEAETEFRAFLSDMLGPDAAAILLGGAVNTLTGADIAGRVGLSQLWFRDADKELEGRGAYFHLLEQAAGPMGGVLKNALVGKQLMDEGHLMRGVETVLPKALKDVLKAGRYATQGVSNLRGDALVEDLNVWQTLLQLNGFTPAEVAAQYDRNRSLKNYEQHILDRRGHLVDAYAMANRTGDDEGRRDVLDAIRAFNQANPEIPVTTSTIRRSLLSRAKYSEKAEGGIVLNRKIAARVREAVGE